MATHSLDRELRARYPLGMLTPDDAVLAARIRTGDHPAFTELVERYADIALEVAYRFVGSRDLALDCVQNMFTRIWTNRERFAPVTSLNNYVVVSARNEAMTYLRYQERRPDLRGRVEVIDPAEVHDVESLILNRATLDTLLARLPERQRLAVHLRYVRQFSYAEIGHALDISAGAAEQLVIRAMDLLRRRAQKKS